MKRASVFWGGRQDYWLAALLLEERCCCGLQNEFCALNALVLITLRESSRGKQENEIGEDERHTEIDKVKDRRKSKRKAVLRI